MVYGPFSFCGHPSCPRLGRLPAGKSDLCNIWEFSQWPTRLAFQALEAEAQREASVPSVPVWAVFLQECSKDHLLQNQLGCDKCRFPGHAMRIWPGNPHFLNKLHKGLFCRLKFENYWSKAFFWISVLFLFLWRDIHPLLQGTQLTMHGIGPHPLFSTGPNIYKKLK